MWPLITLFLHQRDFDEAYTVASTPDNDELGGGDQIRTTDDIHADVGTADVNAMLDRHSQLMQQLDAAAAEVVADGRSLSIDQARLEVRKLSIEMIADSAAGP